MKVWNETSYNKHAKQGHGTLIGNWNEEKTLRTDTGVGRSKMGVHTKKQRDLLFSLPADEIRSKLDFSHNMNSFERVVPGSRNNSRFTHNSQYGLFDDRASGYETNTMGPRYKLIEQQFLSQTSNNWQEKEKEMNKVDYSTTYSTLHDQKPIDTQNIGRKISKDIDGKRLTTANRDVDFLVDTNMLKRPQQNTDEELKQFIDPNLHYSKDQPMSYWMEKVHHKNFYSSKIPEGSNEQPFKKNNEFLSGYPQYSHVKKQ